MPNDNSVGADLSTVQTDLGTVENAVESNQNILNNSITLENITQGHVRVTSTSNTLESVLEVGGAAFVGGQLITSSLSGATAEMRIYDGSVADINKVCQAKAGANESIMCGATPANVQNGAIVQLKSDGINTVEGLFWILSATPEVYPVQYLTHLSVIQTPLSTAVDPADMSIAGTGGVNTMRGMLEFPFADLPFGREVDSATLYMKCDAANNNVGPVVVYGVLKEWIYNQVSWSNRVTGTPWATAGLGSGTDRDAVAQDSVPGPATVGTTYEWDVTSWVQELVNRERENYGLLVQGEAPFTTTPQQRYNNQPPDADKIQIQVVWK